MSQACLQSHSVEVSTSSKIWDAGALMQDVEVLVHMARRRCMDDKAAVRKAGLQLLEALLMMRARGAGGADVELPAEQDIRALEAATADALVRFALLPCI